MYAKFFQNARGHIAGAVLSVVATSHVTADMQRRKITPAPIKQNIGRHSSFIIIYIQHNYNYIIYCNNSKEKHQDTTVAVASKSIAASIIYLDIKDIRYPEQE